MSILISTNKKLIRVSQDYSAGDNIGINDYVISSRNWTPDITYTSESAYQRATNYTDTQISSLSGEVSAEVSHLSSDIDYISGVALTSHQSLEGYLTKASGDEYYQPIGSYATVSQLESTSGDITALIPDTSNFITNSSAEATYQPIGNYLSSNALEGYATNESLDTASSFLSGAIDYVSANAGGTGEYVPLDTNNSNVNINLRNKEWQFSGSYSQGKISLGDGSNGAYISYSNTGGHPEYNWTIGGYIGGIGGYHYKLSRLGVSGDDWKFGSAEYNRLVPTSTTADENKILSVNNQGNPEWVTAGGAIFPSSADEAVQCVQTNSGNWQDITAYQNNSGTYLTAVDLSPYQTTADANTLSSMLSGAIDYVSANAGKVYEGVSPIVVNNTEDKISADTWTFSAGSNVSFVDDNVNKITRIDCTVTGYNETVLFSANGVVSATLSEPMTNFSRLKIRLGCLNGADGTQYVEVPAIPSAIKNLTYNAGGGSNFYFVGLYCSADENSITITKEAALLKAFGSTAYGGQAEVTGYKPALHEVIGVNRKY